MGNLTSFEVNLDDFDIDNPTPINDGQQKQALARCKDTGRLDFSLQNLTDIPVQIFELQNLTSLNLSVNKLKFLSPSLFDLVHLTMLDISANELETLPTDISRLTNLQQFNLRHNRISLLPPELGKILPLQKINLEYNRLKSLPTCEGMANLVEIRLRYNRLTSMPDHTGSIKDTLDLQNNQLTEVPAVAELSTLKELLLIDNHITRIDDSICELKSLTRLHACNNRISKLPRGSLSALAALTELDLRENQITELPSAFGELTAMKRLTLANNKLKSLPPELWNITGMSMLNVGGNSLSELPPGLTAVTALKELVLGGNCFTQIPPDVMSLTGLQILHLGWNSLTTIPPQIGQLVRVSILFLNGNHIGPTLPPEIGQMRGMKELYLGANELVSLPDSIVDMKALELMDLRLNRLTSLPNTIKGFNFLENLDIGDNPELLPANLPAELESKKNLHMVNTPSITRGRYTIAHADMKGKRFNMEDAVVVNCAFRGGSKEEDYFAVFDGHGGDKAAHYGAKRHPEILSEQLKACEGLDEDDVIEAIRTSFIECSREMTHENIRRSGTTAVITILLHNKLYVADVGDSRAVMWRGGKAIRVSLDHKPDLPGEEKRIRNLGGFVSPNGRVVGMLAVSRAFGDVDLQPFVSAEPFVDVIDVTDPPEFLILACDGVWDVISDEAACAIVSSETDLTRAAMKVRDLAYCYGSQDNISVIVIRFSKNES